jgi:hypothetical protein
MKSRSRNGRYAFPVTARFLRVSAAVILLLAVGAGGCAGRQAAAESECLRAKIGGRIVCLHKRQRCERRYERLYVLYGFTCVRGADGRYRLRERNFVARPNP